MKAVSNADSDGIPPMKAYSQCRFGCHSSEDGFSAIPIRMAYLRWHASVKF
jgi:hypothetical protein